MIELHDGPYATATEAVQALRQAGQHVADDAVRDWRRRELIEPAAVLDGQPYYRMRDIWRVERDLREREDERAADVYAHGGPRRAAGRRRSHATPTAEEVDE